MPDTARLRGCDLTVFYWIFWGRLETTLTGHVSYRFLLWCYFPILFPAYLISCPPSHPCVCPAAAKQQGQDRNGLLYTCWRCLVIIYVESDMGKWRFLFLLFFSKIKMIHMAFTFACDFYADALLSVWKQPLLCLDCRTSS